MNKNSGSTLVEVIIAFAMLMIISAALYKTIELASEMNMRSRDVINEMQDINSVIYLEDDVVNNALFYDVPYTGVTVNNLGDAYITLTIDEEKTSPFNQAGYSHIPLYDSHIKYYMTKQRTRFFKIY